MKLKLNVTQAQLLEAQTAEQLRAHLQRMRSNAGTAHDSRPRRQRSRRDSKRAAIREQRGD
jgi:hypothetical protein